MKTAIMMENLFLNGGEHYGTTVLMQELENLGMNRYQAAGTISAALRLGFINIAIRGYSHQEQKIRTEYVR